MLVILPIPSKSRKLSTGTAASTKALNDVKSTSDKNSACFFATFVSNSLKVKKIVHRYRRKEANARERQRQGEINTGFDKLREKIPHPGPSNGKCEKLRKIDILHVAIEYIR